MTIRTTIRTGLFAAALAATGAASAAPSYFFDLASFTAISGGNFHTNSFGAPLAFAPISIDFGDVEIVSQTAPYWGNSLYATDGLFSIGIASPYSLTFNFAAPVTAFGIDVIDLGFGTPVVAPYMMQPQPTDFYSDIGGGPVRVLSGYSGMSEGAAIFFGVFDAAGFSSVTLQGTSPYDFIAYDLMRTVDYVGPVAGVPEPASWAMLIAGFGLTGAVMRRRRFTAIPA